MAGTAYDFTLTTLSGTPYPLSALRGRPILVVNTASQCGFTPQYAALEALSVQAPSNLAVIGVPSNDFGNQEPGDAAAIGEFCDRHYGVTFPVMTKAHVKGKDADPFFRWLAAEGGFLSRPRWNFYKYLIGPDGRLADWFASLTTPDSDKIRQAIAKAAVRE